MREILFKAKTRYNPDWENIQEGIWLEGNLRLDSDMETAYISGFNYYTADFALQREEFEYQVDPETISEYIGLTDKNGRKIFEGDIVSYNGTYHKVVFENRNGTGYFGIVVGKNETWGFGNSTPAYMMAVVGNIHDNPDLLEVSKE